MKAFEILCTIAWRNLWRNPLRTLLTTGTVAGGLALLLVFLGLGSGTHNQMLRNAVLLGGAHVAVQARGFQSTRAMDRTLPLEALPELAAALARAGILRAEVLPRVFLTGLASSADGSSGVTLTGLDPEVESRASMLAGKLIKGRFLEAGAPHAAVIGQGVARKLKLAPGNKFVLMAQGPGSREIQSMLVRVAGVMQTGVEELDQLGVLVPLASAQELAGLPGRIHQAGVVLETAEETGRAASLLGAAAPAGAEVLAWDELMPGLRDFIRIDDAGMMIIDVIFFLIVAFMVMNTLLMSVLERRREFGLLDAIGLTPQRRFFLVLLEAAWIGLMAAAGGALAGLAGHGYLHARGFPMHLLFSSGFSAAGTAIDPVIHSVLPAPRLAGAVGLVLLMTLVLALVPAWKAARAADARLLGQG